MNEVGTFGTGIIGENEKLATGTGSTLMTWVNVSAPLHAPGLRAISVTVSVPTLSYTIVGKGAVDVSPCPNNHSVEVALVAPPVGVNGMPWHNESGMIKCPDTRSLYIWICLMTVSGELQALGFDITRVIVYVPVSA